MTCMIFLMMNKIEQKLLNALFKNLSGFCMRPCDSITIGAVTFLCTIVLPHKIVI